MPSRTGELGRLTGSVAQARAEGLTIVTADAAIARYGVRAMAAGR